MSRGVLPALLLTLPSLTPAPPALAAPSSNSCAMINGTGGGGGNVDVEGGVGGASGGKVI
jgi:hypothetical protein